MYCGSLVFSAIAASRLLLAGDDQVVGGNNSCTVGSLRSVIAIFSSAVSRGGTASFAGAGSAFISFFFSCGSVTSVVSFGALKGLDVTALFTSSELFLATIAGPRESRLGASDGSLERCFAAGVLDSSFAVGSSETLIFSCASERVEVRDQTSRTATWIAKDAAKKPANRRWKNSTVVCYCRNVCLSKSCSCNASHS